MTRTVRIGVRLGERVLTRSCCYCREEFEPVRRHQVFCRRSCRLAHFKRRENVEQFDPGDPILFDV